jgi:hypothetical protein
MRTLTQYEKENIILTNRFLTSSKESAFLKAEELNADANGKHWLVGMRIKDRVAIDIDSHDSANLGAVVRYYSDLFHCTFICIKTNKGFHLIQKHKEDKTLLQFSRCRILFPFMSFHLTDEITQEVNKFFEILKTDREIKQYTLKELQGRAKEIPIRAKQRGLDFSIGNIDVLHALLGIQKKYYVIRIMKKTKDEKMELITI